LLIIVFGVMEVPGWGQLLQWNTFGNTGNETTEITVFNNPNILAATLTHGSITAETNTNRFGGSNWFNNGNTAGGNTLSDAVAGNDYIQFIVTPKTGYSFTPTSFSFSWDRSPTGPSSVTLRSSADNFTTNVGSVTGMPAALNINNTISITGLTGLTAATTFRLYGYGATTTTGTGGFDVVSDIVNVQLNGTTASTEVYRSHMTGVYETANTWEYSNNNGSTWNIATKSPDSINNIIIQATHNITLSNNVTRLGTTINNGTIIINGKTLTFKNAITGSGTYTGSPVSSLVIDSTIGGTFTLPTSVTLQNVTVSGNRTLLLTGNGNLTLHGALIIDSFATYDNGGESEITNGGGNGSVNIFGTFITRDAQGFTGTSAAIPNINPTINAGSTIEYGRSGNQTVNTSPAYKNLTFSGSGTKSPTGAISAIDSVTIIGAAIVNVSNYTFGNSNTKFTMSGGRFITAGVSTKPDMGGIYNLSAGVIEFTNVENTLETIRLNRKYNNIEISGSNVGISTSTGSIEMNYGSTFTVKSAGTFKVQNTNGFTGAVNTAVGNTNSPLVILEPGSTIDYNSTSTSQIITGRDDYSNLTSSGAAIKTFSDNPSIAGNFINTSTGTVTAPAVMTFNGTGPQRIDGLTWNNIDFGGTGLKHFISKGSLTGTLSMSGNNVTLDADGPTNNVAFTLKSTSILATARIADLTNNNTTSGNTIMGNVTVERFIPARRAYRLISPSVTTTSTIRDNWMEGGLNTSPSPNPNPGFGTHITGEGGSNSGFDQTSTNNPSLFRFDNNTLAWVAAINSAGTLSAGSPWRLMVRGNRSTDLNTNTPAPTNTILRATGTLETGAISYNSTGEGVGVRPPLLNSTPNSFNLIGNPYASPVDWEALSFSKDVKPFYTIWDPQMNVRGAYVTYNTGGIITPSGGNSDISQNIQLGQAFFVQTGVGSDLKPVVTFSESAKVSGNTNVFRTSSAATKIAIQLLLNTNEGRENIADGVVTIFDTTFLSTLGNEDSYKFNNEDENLAINRNGAALSIEGRPVVTTNDTVLLRMWKYRQSGYFLKFTGNNFSTSISAYLEDAYLNTKIPINLTDTTIVPFSITNDSASASSDRFMIVFKNADILPVTITSLKAYQKEKGIQVEWISQNQLNIDRFEVEKSIDAFHFKRVSSVAARGNNIETEYYGWFDVNPIFGNSYYRIKFVEKSGEIKYTAVVKVIITGGEEEFDVYPNPVKGNIININLKNIERGKYNFFLYDNIGQLVYSALIAHNGGEATYKVPVPARIGKGSYKLKISNIRTKKVMTLLIQ